MTARSAVIPRSPDFSMGAPISTARPWKDQRPKRARRFICMGLSVSGETLKSLVRFEEPGDNVVWEDFCERMRTPRSRYVSRCSDYPWTRYGPDPVTAQEVENRRQAALRKLWTVRAITQDLKRSGTLVPNRAIYDLELERRLKAGWGRNPRGFGCRYQITLNRDDRPALIRRAGSLVFSDYVVQLILRQAAKRAVSASLPLTGFDDLDEHEANDETWLGNPS